MMSAGLQQYCKLLKLGYQKLDEDKANFCGLSVKMLLCSAIFMGSYSTL